MDEARRKLEELVATHGDEAASHFDALCTNYP
jgi:hypothetical protein